MMTLKFKNTNFIDTDINKIVVSNKSSFDQEKFYIFD